MTPYRKPTTTDPQDFWFILQEMWDGYLRDATGDDAKLKKNALNNLRKFDAAGRIMETDEGRNAAVRCQRCSRFTDKVPYRLFTNCNDIACVYCKCHNKSSCSAKAENDEDAAIRADKLAAGNKSLHAENDSLKSRVDVWDRRMDKLEDYVGQQQSKASLTDGRLVFVDARLQE